MTFHLLLHAVQHAPHVPHLLAAVPHAGPTPTGGLSGVGGASGGGVSKPAYDEFLRAMLQLFIFLANLSGGLVVGVAVVRGLVIYVVDLVRRRGEPVPTETIRLSLSRALALALEFQLGADILGTALEPSLQDLLTLGAIVVLRTVLNYFIGREIKEAAERDAQGSERTPANATHAA